MLRSWFPLLALVVAAAFLATGVAAQQEGEVQVITDPQGDAGGVSAAHDLLAVWIGVGDRSAAESATGPRVDVRMRVAALEPVDVAWYRIHWDAASFHRPEVMLSQRGIEIEYVAGAVTAVPVRLESGTWMATGAPLEANVDQATGTIQVIGAFSGGGIFPSLSAFGAESSVRAGGVIAMDRAEGDVSFTPPALLRLDDTISVPRRGHDVEMDGVVAPAGLLSFQGAWFEHLPQGIRATHQFVSLQPQDLEACQQIWLDNYLSSQDVTVASFLALTMGDGHVASAYMNPRWIDDAARGEEGAEHPLWIEVAIQFGAPGYMETTLLADDWPGLPLYSDVYRSAGARCTDQGGEQQTAKATEFGSGVAFGAGRVFGIPFAFKLVAAAFLLPSIVMVVAGVVLFVRLFRD